MAKVHLVGNDGDVVERNAQERRSHGVTRFMDRRDQALLRGQKELVHLGAFVRSHQRPLVRKPARNRQQLSLLRLEFQFTSSFLLLGCSPTSRTVSASTISRIRW